MKVLIVYPNFWIYGGAEKVIVRLCNYLTDHFIDNTILTTQMIPEIKKELTETRILEVGDYAHMHDYLMEISEDFDVINIHNDPCQLMVYPKKMNTVWSFNELPSSVQLGGELSEPEIRIVQNFMKRIIVADETNQEKVKKVYNKDSIIVPYGIDFDFFQQPVKEDMRERYGLEKNDFVITQVAFIAPTKNQLETVRIFAEVKKTIPNAKLVLAGLFWESILPLEEYKKQVEEEIFKLKLYGEVIFTGKLTHEEVRDLLRTSNIAIQPNKGQGSWLSVFEALSCGIPILVSDEFTGANLVAMRENGYICKNTDKYVAVINAIHRREEDPSGEGMDIDQEWIEENLTWDNYCRRIVEVFDESCIN